MAVAQAPAGAALLSGRLHLLGGYQAESRAWALHQVYDPRTGAWSRAAPLIVGRDGGAAAVVDSRIYLVGGYDAAGTPLDVLEAYTPSSLRDRGVTVTRNGL
jgi:N-acetylneuraminic acid mutarotase